MSAESAGSVTTDVVALIPALRAFAWSLCRDSAEADDLVQDTLLKALSNIEKFEPGTQLRAWLFTIMRNTFYSRVKVRAREKTGMAECVADGVSVAPTQEWSLRGGELMDAVARLPAHYRETLILVVMLGESYEKAAEICGCRIGTIKSRINRARSMLMAELGETVH
ncbi:sigma-70 family RNA polymerase sigma factor [Halodurantibacterium flavum]|uniref:RNA polymerase sigma factor n=1 Tax=Halodurantibacterium flavum TaxID=1382802 RepID=A0ABW4S7K8_9RHOB